MKRISFHLAKINDHTGSIKRKLVLVLSCSERWNGEWIESERHMNRTNEWQHMEKCWKSGKRKGEKKKKTETVIGRTIARTLDWMDFWWNFRAILSSWMVLACLFLCAYTRCSIVFANIYFRHVAAISRGQCDSAFMFRANTKTTVPEDWRRRNNNKRFSFTSYLLFLPPFPEQFDKRFLRNSRNSMETTPLLLI